MIAETSVLSQRIDNQTGAREYMLFREHDVYPHIWTVQGTDSQQWVDRIKRSEDGDGSQFFWLPACSLTDAVEFLPAERDALDRDEVFSSVFEQQPRPLPHQIDARNWLVMVIKPDGLKHITQRQLGSLCRSAGLSIENVNEGAQLCVEQIKSLWTPRERFDPSMPTTEWELATYDYMTEAPVTAILLHGTDASKTGKAIKNYLRTAYNCDPHAQSDVPVAKRVRSFLHSTETTEELVRSLTVFWRSLDIRRLVEEIRRDV